MVAEHKPSRRAFVVGGAATAAVVGPIAAGMVTSSKPMTLWTPPAPQATMAEIKQWEALIGKSFKMTTETGSCFAYLCAVRYAAADSGRPASLSRQVPFTAYFQAATTYAPVGQKSYRVLHPTQGAMNMFVARAEDRRGFALLTATYN
jgi:hypothetical protein